MPEFLLLEKYALNHKRGKIISQSWGATENTLFDPAGHYNQGRPHSSLGPGIPDPQKLMPQARDRRPQLPAARRIRSKDVVGGLHH